MQNLHTNKALVLIKHDKTRSLFSHTHTHHVLVKHIVTDLPSVDKKDSGARDGWEGMISHVAHSRVINETSDEQQESCEKGKKNS